MCTAYDFLKKKKKKKNSNTKQGDFVSLCIKYWINAVIQNQWQKKKINKIRIKTEIL